MIKYLTITILIFNLTYQKKDIEQIELSQDNKSQKVQGTLVQSQKFYKISLSDLQLSSSDNFFLIVESNDDQLKVKIYDTSELVQLTDKKILIDLMTYSGNLALAMSNTYFNSKLDFFRKNKELYISIEKDQSYETNIEFTIRVEVTEHLNLPIGKTYTTRLDQKLENLTVTWNYDKNDFNNLNKLRFQALSVLNKDNYSLQATLKDNYSSYKMNNLFKNLVGGVLDSENFNLCSDKCKYKMTLEFQGVKVVNFESFLVEDIEELSIYHYGEYYDKVYQQKQSSYYKLKYVPEIEGMDISINLIPVTGNTGLYVNPKTKPLKFESYLFKQTGPLAKRITIKWEELQEMKAEKQDLFISVQSFDQGEFLIKIDAHESDYRGRLSSGISEQGYVKGDEMGSYLYSFQVYQTQDIDFTVQLNIFSGEADLYLKQCKTQKICQLTEKDVNQTNDILTVKNEDNFKSITHSFQCKSKHKHSFTICNFLIGVYGKENHKTHYELSIQENKFHTLMTPGNDINISLMPDQIKYFKFSYPGGSEINSQLYLQIEPEWGSFAVAISKKDEFPSSLNNSFYQEFLSHESNLYNSSKSINLGQQIKDYTDIGLYYIAIIAKTNASLSLKFYQKNKTQFAIHTLQAGKQQKGMISNSEEIVYYMINLSLDEDKASSVSIDIVPIKGQFVIFASRSGKLPSKQQNEIISTNDHLDLLYKNYDRDHQYIIGVQGNTQLVNQDVDYSFKISLTYKNKTTKLSPGIISTYQAKDQNYFSIEVFQEMNDLLILKGVNDGYNLLMCAQFNKKFDIEAEQNCEKSADNKRMGIYFKKKQLQTKCKDSFKSNKNCLLYISISGFSDQKFSIGYTYNEQPIKITEGQILIGPGINDKDYKLNFIYHCKDNDPVAIYFNSKGQNLKIYSKLIGNKEIQSQDNIIYPNVAYQDEDNKKIKGHITTVIYPSQQIKNKGESAEILLSVQIPKSKSKFKSPFDMKNGFLLQSFNNNKEILRTQVHQEHVYEEQWYYFNFYNNGNQDKVQVYANANHSTVLNLMIARDKDSQPPFDQRPLVQKTSVGQVYIELTPQILKDNKQSNQSTKGYFTVAIKSSSACLLNIYWNNKQDLNYIELTPNIPSTMHLVKDKPLFFYFYAQERPGTDMNDKITIHWKSDIKSKMYLKKSLKSELIQPTENNNDFKSSLGKNGGIAVLQILPNNSNYCNDCSYIGKIESDKDGQVLLMANVEHSKISCTLTTGFTFPDLIEAQRGKTYRYLNLDQEPFYINLSYLNGSVNVFVGKDESVDGDNNIKTFFTAQYLSSHAHLEVNPKQLGIKDDEDIFIRLENSKLDSAALTINIFKNFLHSPLEPGITRMIALESNQKIKLFFRNKTPNQKFELRATLKKIDKRSNEEIALQKLDEIITTTFEDYIDVVIAETLNKKIINNKIYLEFDPQMQQEGLYYFWVKNPFNYQIHVQLDLVQGKQMLVNLNENIIDHNIGKESSVYEAYGQQGRFWFMDLKICYGEVLTRFYEDDFDKVGSTDFKKYKSVKDSNSIAHYFHLESDKVFTELINKDTKQSVYSFTFYNEQDLNDNPYSDITQKEDGRVKVHTDLNQLQFEPLKIKNIKNDDFIHKITYRAYLSPDFKVMRYLKNCNDHLIDKIFIKPQFLVKEKTFYYKNTHEFNKQKTIDLKFTDLEYNVKYYGVVTVDLELLPAEEGWIDPVRTTKSYYDEFIFVSTKLSIPINLLTGGLIVLVIFYIIYQIVYNYVFGELYDVQKGNSLNKFTHLTNNVLGINTEDILESDFEIEEEQQKSNDKETPLDVDKEVNLEMDDKTTPLDINQ